MPARDAANGQEWEAKLDRLRRQVMSTQEAAILAVEYEALVALAEWLISLDDPEDVLGREERRSVTLTEITERARKAWNGD